MMPKSFALTVVVPLLFLWGVRPTAGQNARPYRSLAVMNLELDGAAAEEGDKIVDYLTMRIRETRRVRQVAGREELEELPSREAQVERSRDYEQDQLSLATRLPVQVAVLGRLSWNEQQYRLQLRLVEVQSGEVLFEQGGTYAGKGELYAGCDQLAIAIASAAAWSPAPKTAARKPRQPLDLAMAFGLGQEGVSASSAVAGGSYLYLETLALLNRFVGVDARYAFRLFPTVWRSHLLSTHLRLQLPPKKSEVFTAGELGYRLSIDEQRQLSHFVGVRLVPVGGGEDEFFFELLPVGLYFDVSTGETVFTLELLAMRFLITKR